MKSIPVIVFFICFFLASCRQSVEFDDIKNKEGLYFNSATAELLDGKYISVTSDPDGDRESVITMEFKDGVPIGEWEEKYENSTIHSGYYITHKELATKIEEMTNSKRVDLNLWEEAGFPYLTLELIEPANTDSNKLNEVIEITKMNLKSKFHFKTINIDSSGYSSRKRIFTVNIK